MYEKIDQTLQKTFKYLRIGLLEVMPNAVVLPKSFVCLFMYYATDSGVDAFELPLPGKW